MNGKDLSESLRAGRRVYGTLIVSPSPRWPTVVGTLGLDFVFLDTEHIPLGRETLSWMCRTYRAMGIAPVVRIPKPDPYQACMAIDGGACGVIVPYVETVQETGDLVGAVKLRPLKGRRLADALSGRKPLEPPLAEYLRKYNADNVAIVNIESVAAMEALDGILAVPGLDAVLIGPHDLSISLGIPEQYDSPKFDQAVRTIVQKARAKGVGAGIHFSNSVAQHIAWAQAGANLILHSVDMTLFADCFRRDLAAFKDALGEAPGKGQGKEEAI